MKIQPNDSADSITPGRFITIEGGEGAGKTTQSHLLVSALREMGLRVLKTREPGGSPGSEVIRDLLLSGKIEWSARAEAMLHFAARAQHIDTWIAPVRAAGTWFVSDRYYDSTMAYQGYGQGADRGFIGSLIGLIGLVPDLTVVLDVTSDVARDRMVRRNAGSDRYERMDAAFHERVNAGFLRIAQAEPSRCVIIPADGCVVEVHMAIMKIVRERLNLIDELEEPLTEETPCAFGGC